MCEKNVGVNRYIVPKKMALVAPQRQSHSQFEKVFFLDSLNFHNHQ